MYGCMCVRVFVVCVCLCMYMGWAGGRGRGGWEDGGGLNPPLGLFTLAMGLRSASYIGPNMLEWRKRCLPITRVNFRPMPSM